MTEPLWTPSAERVRTAQLTRFLARAAERCGRPLRDYTALHQWSIDRPADFWALLWEFCAPLCSAPWREVVDDPTRMPGARWFAGARLNFAENLLRYRDARPALVFRSESGAERQLTFAELADQVARLARALRGMGVRPGDRVAGLLPNLPESVIAMLASVSVGATWSSCSPDFGPAGVVDRFGQIEPRVLFAADGYFYGGRPRDSRPLVAEVAAKLPALAKLVIVPYVEARPDLRGLPSAERFDDVLGAGAAPPLAFEQLPADHPLYIMYSSGTTGVPKCIVHGAGGVLLQHLKELVLHTDLRREDRIFYFTTCGWMMWNWLVSALAVGSTVVLYDGSPFWPDARALFQLVDELGVSVFGTSARFLAAAEKAGVRPREAFAFRALRSVLSTGSPLAPAGFDYVYRDVKADVQLASISGGTDIVSCFLLGNPLAPVYRGELQCPGLGMKVETWDESGQPVVGEPGELVCTLAAPSMPLGLWGDASGARYRATYFERFPGVWHHGDLVELTPRGGAIIYGRSDATLNPGGVRIGTAEIYRQVETLPEIADSVVVAQEHDGDVRVVLFVKLAAGAELDAALVERVRATIRSGASPRHVPAVIARVDDIPYTLSGKKVELAVREVIHGRPVKNRDALANPEALEGFRNRPELRA